MGNFGTGTDPDDDFEYHPPTRKQVLADLESWRRRLNALYADIISWLPAEGGYETKEATTEIDEPPMRFVGVAPETVPTLEVRRHGELMATFRPDTCWIVGVLSRVMVFTGLHPPHKLVEVDLPEPGWRLFRSDWPSPEWGKPIDIRWRRGVPLDQPALVELVGQAHG